MICSWICQIFSGATELMEVLQGIALDLGHSSESQGRLRRWNIEQLIKSLIWCGVKLEAFVQTDVLPEAFSSVPAASGFGLRNVWWISEVLLVSEILRINPVKTRLSFGQTLKVRRSLTWRRRYAALLMRLISVQRVMGESLGLCGCEELVMRRLNTSASLRLTADAHYTRAPKLNSSDRLRWFKQLLYYTEFGFYCIAALLLVQWNISKTWYYCSTLSEGSGVPVVFYICVKLRINDKCINDQCGWNYII